MKKWNTVYRLAGLPECLCDESSPEIGALARDVDEGFPPALIPIWHVDENCYWGAWCHSAVGVTREISFVEYCADYDLRVREIARTFEQLIVYIGVQFVANGGPPAEVVEFLAWAKVSSIEEVREIVAIRGADEERVLKHPAFAVKLPLMCCLDGVGYDGAFPSPTMPVEREFLVKTCPLEYGADLRARISSTVACPEWLTAAAPHALAATLAHRNENRGAWLAINAAGVRYDDARGTLAEISRNVGTPFCAALIEAWSSETHERWGAWI
jgi:hypothetical protein